MEKYKFLEHTADIKFQAFGKSLGEAFKNSALAMISAMTDNKIKARIKKKIAINGKDYENLLYNFLEELLFLLDSENFIFSSLKNMKIEKNKLEAEVLGDKAGNYNFHLDVKAVTYNEMFVRQDGKKWVCQVVLDV